MLTAVIVSVSFCNRILCLCLCNVHLPMCLRPNACTVCLLCSNDQFQYTLQELVYFSGLHLFPFGCLTCWELFFHPAHRLQALWCLFYFNFIIKKLSTTQNYPFESQVWWFGQLKVQSKLVIVVVHWLINNEMNQPKRILKHNTHGVKRPQKGINR